MGQSARHRTGIWGEVLPGRIRADPLLMELLKDTARHEAAGRNGGPNPDPAGRCGLGEEV